MCVTEVKSLKHVLSDSFETVKLGKGREGADIMWYSYYPSLFAFSCFSKKYKKAKCTFYFLLLMCVFRAVLNDPFTMVILNL